MSDSLASRASAPVTTLQSESGSMHPLYAHSALESQASLELQAPLTPCVETVTLSITEGDFYWSQRSGLGNPILCALQRHTQTLWRLYDDGFALEAMPPYRACQLPPELLQAWRAWQVTGQLEARTWSLELVATQQCDNYSLIQRRHTNIREKATLQHPEKDGNSFA